MSTEPLLSVRNLKKHYPITSGVLKREVGRVRAVDGISFDIAPGETLGLVGESGCGKSTAATTLLQLEAPTEGEIRFASEDITNCDKSTLRRFRRRAQMVFQDPNSSFDPRMTIGESVAEPLRVQGLPAERRRPVVTNLLERLGLERTDIDQYPHEFSGGQKQRIALARALVVNPDLIVADEPVSALDVSIQAEILSLIDTIQSEFGLSILFISHDMGVVRQVCDRIAVMYLGEIVELSTTEELFSDPQHPYTRALLSSIPVPDPRQRGSSIELTGNVPSPSRPPSGCRFHTRCPEVIQPDGYEFEQANWRNVLNLRQRLERNEFDLDGLRDLHAERDGVEPSTLSDERMAAAVRDEFDLPDVLSDSAAERVLASAIESILDGDNEVAASLLRDEFTTVCEKRHPTLQETYNGRLASCHLLNEPARTTDTEPTLSTDD